MEEMRVFHPCEWLPARPEPFPGSPPGARALSKLSTIPICSTSDSCTNTKPRKLTALVRYFQPDPDPLSGTDSSRRLIFEHYGLNQDWVFINPGLFSFLRSTELSSPTVSFTCSVPCQYTGQQAYPRAQKQHCKQRDSLVSQAAANHRADERSQVSGLLVGHSVVCFRRGVFCQETE
jgi:hypothetical protein